MALLVDGSWCEPDELQAYDGSATNVAAEEGIDLSAKMALSEAWITDKVDDFLRWESNYGPGGCAQCGLSVKNAVVDDRLKRWHLTNTLALLYRDASFSQVNDRFQKKCSAYETDAARFKDAYFNSGVPYASNPVRRPAAPTVTVTAGHLAAAAYFVATSQVDVCGNESALSDITSTQASDGNVITVVTNGVAAGSRWNVYAADNNGVMRRQNDVPMEIGVAWTIPDTGLIDGVVAANGQVATGRVRPRRLMPRG